MLRFICALLLVLLVVSPSFGQQSLVGTYKIVSLTEKIDGTPTENTGKARHGYLVLTPTRAIIFFTTGDRKFGTSAADKAALLDTLVGWSGTYRIEGGRITFAVDTSWNETYTGQNIVRNWALSGNRLTFTSDPQPHPRDPSKMAVIRQVWEKIE